MAKLKALIIDRPMKPGRYGDGGGLYLLVGPNGAKSWVFRYRAGKQDRSMGLGPYPTVTLAVARDLAAECRKVRSQGNDPQTVREAERERQRQDEARSKPFKDCAEEYIAANEAGWKNDKHKQQWRNTMAAYIYPVLGATAASAVDTEGVLRVLRQDVPAEVTNDGRTIRAAGPLWVTRPDTAQRVRGRIELVLDWCKAHGYRSGENPAAWRGNIQFAWPNRGKKRKRKHHPALPYTEIPAFMQALRKQDGAAALALEFCILNAPRTMEVLASRLPELDRTAALWTIPPERMKADQEHRIPLSAPALAVLEKADAIRTRGDFVFQGRKNDRPLSNMSMLMLARRMGFKDSAGRPITVHGFRSTFRDWVADCTNFPREVAEMALAHTIDDDTEAAYRRGELMEKRRALMAAWADYCDGKSNVVNFRSVAA